VIKENGAEPMTVRWQSPMGVLQGQWGPDGWQSLNFESGRSDWTAEDPFRMIPPPEGKSLRIAPKDLEEMTLFLKGYFEGKPNWVRPRLDMRQATPFLSAVWRRLIQVPFGQSMTYGELAQAVDRPNGARAIGQALRRNQLLLAIPCHRVLARGGNKNHLGGFSAGLGLKRKLLEHEKIHFSE
jgi:methylated-DNA-[protein]-cysteine S-methyltransferase